MENKVSEEIVEWLSKPENEEILQTLKLIKESSESTDWYDTLKNSEKESVEKGQRDHQEGNVISSDDFWEKHSP